MEKGWEDTIVFTFDLGSTPSPTKSEREAMNAVPLLGGCSSVLAAHLHHFLSSLQAFKQGELLASGCHFRGAMTGIQSIGSDDHKENFGRLLSACFCLAFFSHHDGTLRLT